MTPNKLTHGSSKKVWWKCKSKGHEWQAVIAARTRAVGCPYCANRKACEDNCLANNDPLGISEEWHPTKNGILTPFDVLPKSNKKVWWKCKYKGHEWQTIIRDRSYCTGCPYCTNQKVCVDNCLANNDPLGIKEEWHPTKNGVLTPFDVTPMSGQKVWWKCKLGHEWQTIIYHRSNGHGCPYCAGNKASGINCLKYNDQHGICLEWHPSKNICIKDGVEVNLTPFDVTPNSSKKVWWKCNKCSREWQATIDDRSRGKGCIKCYAESRKKKVNM